MRLVISLLLLVFTFSLFGQERCAQVPYEKMIHPTGTSEAIFEQWIKTKTVSKRQSSGTQRTQAGTYTIPVVVHVIHNGEAVGTGTNISDAQIQSQIDVLNKDYRRTNTDASSTPAEFQSVAGNMDIQFVLAKQDPEGLATNGIVRVKGTKTGWNLSDGSTFKALSYWRADRYLNIWVINFTDPGGYIGYAQLPLPAGTSLQGLEDASTDSLTDGVTIHYKTFGSLDGGNFSLDSKYNKGRTATHEIGHFFGLRHIWGDVSSCSTTTDYVEDTPSQDAATRTCPTTAQQACGHSKMYPNYMDYTDDNCMNLFTVKQIERMDIVINNCIRRKSLLTSPGALTPVPVANDLGIKSIVTPQTYSCSGHIIPSITVKNYGSNTVTSCRTVIKINGTIAESKDFNISLVPLAEVNLAFSTVNLTASSSTTIHFEVTLVNGITDAKTNNNLLQQTVITPANTALPVTELFNATPPDWSIQNADGLKTWQNVSLTSNSAMMLNFYDYENEGAVDRLVTPVFNLSNETSALLKFDYAYAPFPGVNTDSLSVVVMTDCGAYLTNANTLFNKGGSTLSTATSTSNSFSPTASQWKTETLSLLPFIGQSNVQIAFIARNGYGNNLYLDNVFILNSAINDLALTELKSPGPVFCVADPQPVVKIKNQGSTSVTSFKMETTVNMGTVISQNFTGIQLATGEEKEFRLNALPVSNGQNTLSFNVKDPNGIEDNVPANNSITVNRVLNQATDLIPLRENFDAGFAGQWTIVSQGAAPTWQVATTNYSSSLFYNAFGNTNTGQQSWLVSPVFDFSHTSKAGILFNVSYATRSTGTERLQVLSSTDCGVTYPNVIYDRQASEYSSNNSSTSWLPKTATDWQKDFINLNTLAGKKDVRLAFVITNQNGNNLYLDNLNFYEDDDANPPQISSSFYVYATSSLHDEYNITFNLSERADASVQIYNLIGQKVAEYTLPNTLNQTYPLDFIGGTGIYIVKTQIGSQVNSTRVLVSR